jgi:hypothetical protein
MYTHLSATTSVVSAAVGRGISGPARAARWSWNAWLSAVPGRRWRAELAYAGPRVDRARFPRTPGRPRFLPAGARRPCIARPHATRAYTSRTYFKIYARTPYFAYYMHVVSDQIEWPFIFEGFFRHNFTENGTQDLKMICKDASGNSTQSVILKKQNQLLNKKK